MKYKFKGLFFALLLLVSTVTNVKAEEIDLNKTGSISISLRDFETQQPIVGAEFAIYYIASIKEDSNGRLFYSYVEDLRDCDILVDDPQLSTKLESIVKEIEYTSTFKTDKQGNACISNLPLGLYYVKQVNLVDGYAPCNSFFVTIPILENDTYTYDVNASPKIEIEKLISITIKKEWKADDNAMIPKEVTIELYKEDTVVKTAILNEQNNWQITYSDMPKSDGYYVKEINVPNGFTPIYQQCDYIFTVTNVSSLIDTGQLIWPIPLLGFAGILFITIGFIVLRKTENTND